MSYGMRCHDICPKGTIGQVLDQVQENGITRIQLAMGKSFSGYDFGCGHYSPGFARMIADELRQRNIHVAVLGCYINPIHPQEEKRKSEVAKFIEHLKYAKILGADMVGTETGRYSADFSVTSETYTEASYRLFLESMKTIVDAAEKLGMMIGVEAVHDHTLCTPERMRQFLDEIDSPVVEAILDPVNLIGAGDVNRQEEVIDRAWKLYGDRVTMVHVKDFVLSDGQPEFAHVGEGLFHYEPLLLRIKQDKPFLTLLLENSTAARYHKDVQYLQKIYEEV